VVTNFQQPPFTTEISISSTLNVDNSSFLSFYNPFTWEYLWYPKLMSNTTQLSRGFEVLFRLNPTVSQLPSSLTLPKGFFVGIQTHGPRANSVQQGYFNILDGNPRVAGVTFAFTNTSLSSFDLQYAVGEEELTNTFQGSGRISATNSNITVRYSAPTQLLQVISNNGLVYHQQNGPFIFWFFFSPSFLLFSSLTLLLRFDSGHA
jgi:hypothetical protein